MECGKWFQLNRSQKPPTTEILLRHLDGTSFRNLASQYHISQATAYRYSLAALRSLPHCADITRRYCSRFCGILLVDGKYVSIKGYDRKIPTIYGIDYLTHDIPTYLLTRGENYQSCLTFFKTIRLLNYPLQGLACDDNVNIIEACKRVYPKAIIQLCTNHYKENIRTRLQVRTDPTYHPFMKAIETLFVKKRSWEDISKRATGIMKCFENDEI